MSMFHDRDKKERMETMDYSDSSADESDMSEEASWDLSDHTSSDRPLCRVPSDGPSPNPAVLRRDMSIQEINAVQTKTANDLNVLSEKTGMPITQENGQRRYGPPRDHIGPAPPKGCEVFVGKVPRDVYEPELVPVFEKIGKIYELRLMMDFSGTNRGYCFVHYYKQEDAARAVRELNDTEIRKGRYIGVVKSVDNCRLFIGGLPKDKNEEDILQEIQRITEGVTRVIAYPSPADKTKNRGFAFVEYDCHKTAAMARRKMIPGKIPMWGVDVAVDWAEPEPNVEPEIMNKVQNLYVRNLMLSTTEETLQELFNEHSDNGVDKVKKIKDYAFIHFTSREQAESAMGALDNTGIDGSVVEITWAKPVNKATYKAQKALSKELYPSAVGRMNSRGLRNAYSGGTSSQRVFGSYQQGNYPNQPSLMPLPAHFQTGNGMMSPTMCGFVHGGAEIDLNQLGPRGMAPRQPRPRAAAGVQAIRLPAHQLMTSQQPSRELLQYITAMSQASAPGIVSHDHYVFGIHAGPIPAYATASASQLKKPIKDLCDMCIRCGWGQPSFSTDLVKLETGDYYSGLVVIPQYPLGPKQCRCHDLFQDADDARASAADVMIRLIQSELANVYIQQQIGAASGVSKGHYTYSVLN